MAFRGGTHGFNVAKRRLMSLCRNLVLELSRLQPDPREIQKGESATIRCQITLPSSKLHF